MRFPGTLLLIALLCPSPGFATSHWYATHHSTSRSHGRYRRSTAAKNAFKHEYPCPSTGLPYGSCPGYVIDHVRPLECGGADAPFNMQWQTIADGKTKDRIEGQCR